MWKRIWAVMQKEFIQTFRDRRTLLIQLSIPLIQLVLFGYAISMNVDHIPTVVADQSRDVASRAYVSAMETSGFFDVVAYVSDQAGVIRAIDAGQAQMGIVISPGFAPHVESGDATALLLVDGSNLFVSQSAYNAATSIAEAHAMKVLINQLQRRGRMVAGQNLLPLDALARILYNPNLDDLWFVIPAMVAMILQTQSISMTAVAVVREHEVGTIEQILVTPIRPLELMLGKIAPNILITMVNMLTIVGLGVFWFGVPFQGNFWLFLWLCFMYILSGLGLGLLISTVSQTQNQALQLIVSMMLLGTILGGFVFPRYTMPPVIRIIGNLFPLTYFIPISRAIITKGVGISSLREQVAALFVYILVVMLTAARAFRQRLD